MESFENLREETLRSEATFALSYLSGVLPAEGRLLEVGAGAGYLASCLHRSGRQIDAFEPIAPGFESSRKLQVPDLNWLDSLPEEGEYEAIFANHVLEHIPDWKKVTEVWVNLLAPGGSLILLFPNYAFPYEPHFGVPYLYSKTLTWIFFSRKILAKRPNAKEMFEELSVPRARMVRNHLRALGLECEVDRNYTLSYLERGEDEVFFGRKGWLLRIAMGKMRSVLRFVFNLAPKTVLPVVSIRASKASQDEATEWT